MLKFRIFVIGLLVGLFVSGPLSAFAVDSSEPQQSADDLPYPFIKGVPSLPLEAQLAPGAGEKPDNPTIEAENQNAQNHQNNTHNNVDPNKLLNGAKGYLGKFVTEVKSAVSPELDKTAPVSAGAPAAAPTNNAPIRTDGEIPPITPADVVIRPQVSKEPLKDSSPLSPLPSGNLPPTVVPNADASAGPFSADSIKTDTPSGVAPDPAAIAAPQNPFSNNQAVKEVLQILENNKPKIAPVEKQPENPMPEVPVAPALLSIPKTSEEPVTAPTTTVPTAPVEPAVDNKGVVPQATVPSVQKEVKEVKPVKKVKKVKKQPVYGADTKPVSNDSNRIKLFKKNLGEEKDNAQNPIKPEVREEPATSGLSPETKYIIDMLLSSSSKGRNVVRKRDSVGVNRDDYDTILSGMNDPEVDDIGMKMNVKVSNREADRLLSDAYDAMISGQFETAILLYKKALRIDKKNETGLVGLAGAYQKAGSIDQARKIYARLFELYPDNNDAFVNFLQLVADESPADALLEIKKLEEANPDISALPAQIGMIQWKLGNTQGAIYGLTKALSIDSSNNSYRYNLAVVCDQAGYKERAVALYRNLVEAGKKGQQIPADINSVQERLTFLSSNDNQ